MSDSQSGFSSVIVSGPSLPIMVHLSFLICSVLIIITIIKMIKFNHLRKINNSVQISREFFYVSIINCFLTGILGSIYYHKWLFHLILLRGIGDINATAGSLESALNPMIFGTFASIIQSLMFLWYVNMKNKPSSSTPA